jgi:hypothetical protein
LSYEATVIPVMIASPGDVYEEREIVREVVHSWNYINSLKTKVVLMPAGWETHSSPELGARAQELINSRVLKDCDLLIGVFWTRLGTPTGKAESGTVEEIEEHIQAGKPAMIYFSSKPVVPQSINQEQFNALQAFKSKCKELGIIDEFDDIIEFKDKVGRHLQLCLNNNSYIRRLFPQPMVAESDHGISVQIPSDPLMSKHGITKEAAVLLKAASKDKHGVIMKLATIGGRFIQAGGASFGGQGGRENAKWEHALNELLALNLIIARGYKGEVFELTHEGWAVADTIPSDL